MSRVAFKQADVSRALKGAIKAGLSVGRVEIEPGKITIFADTTPEEPVTDFDLWRSKRDARPA